MSGKISFLEKRKQARRKDRLRRFEKMKNDPELSQARLEMKNEFLEEHPRFSEMTEAQLQKEMFEHRESEDRIRKQKLRSHLETFSDGIIAVIITIMLLEIPLPSDEGYGRFVSSVGVFIVSFIVIANFWFNHHKTFAVTEEITEKIIVQDFVFIGLLSLIPLLSKWTMLEPNWMSSLNYGGLVFVIVLVQEIINHSITKDHFKKMPKSFKFWRKIWALRMIFTLLLNVLITIIAVLFPFYGHWLFVVIPIFNFFFQVYSKDHQYAEAGDDKIIGVPYLK